MIRTSTIIYIVLLLGLVGAYVYLRNRPQPAAEIELTPEATSETTYLFTAEEGTPSGICIEARSGPSVEVARDDENAWAVLQPVEAKADQAAAEAAATQITSIRILDSVAGIEPDIVGLDEPEYRLTVKFTGGAERSIDIGVITPTESGYYVRDAEGKIVIASRSAIDALLGLLDQPPYLETPIATNLAPETVETPVSTVTP